MLMFLFFIGACIGSFLGVLASRLPRNESVIWGRSHCDWCKRPLRWFELIPIISFAIQKGRCLRCKKKLSWSYPLLELFTGFFFALTYARFGQNGELFLSFLILGSAFIVLFLADIWYQILPDSMILVGMIAAAGVIGIRELLPHMIPAIFSFVFFYLLWAVTRGRGMGFGDVKFSFLMGFFLGFPLIVAALYIAFLTGAAVGVILMMRGRAGWKSKIAFGPFLILGTVVAFVWGPYFIALWHTFL